MDYDAKKLPNGFRWVGAVAAPNGYNGHAFLANVAADEKGQLRCFTRAGRFRVTRWWFDKRQVSDQPLVQAPMEFDPVQSVPA